ncbi:DUF6777 domain-containing protein [Streptomyces sp. NPDC048106]|uniref:DUF6777 domain-containing protein n=1 Tax=Streptomyces sp. NPDC048106 TaxID=3155750 RepID=UPI0034511969
MRIPTGSMVMACVLSVALLLTGCAGAAVKEAQLGEEVYLQPAAEQGPNPFTASSATGPAGPGTTRPTGRTADVSAPPAGLAVAPLAAARALSGGTPGLYSGSVRVAGCDVERQIGGLTADPARGDAFAHVAGVSRAGLPGYLRGLTPVLLRADTRVTNHGYRDGATAGYQAVLQAGTAVLVDNRGVPRVRCACGNPLRPPEEARGGVGARGTAWSGYRPNQVIVVTPAPRAVGSLTLLDAGTNTWIERRLGPDVRNDHLVAPPAVSDTAPPDPGLTGFPHPSRPDPGRPSPEESRPNAATGEIGGAVIGTGRVTAGRVTSGRLTSGRGHGEGHAERADDRRTRADGVGAGERERGTRAGKRGAADHGAGHSDGRAEGRSDTGSHRATAAVGHGAPTADDRRGTPTADDQDKPARAPAPTTSPDTAPVPASPPDPTPTASPEARAALPTTALPPASSPPASPPPPSTPPTSPTSPTSDTPTSDTPTSDTPTSDTPAPSAPKPSAPSAAPSFLDPLAYPPGTSLYDPPPFDAPLTPRDPDEIGPPNVTDTPAMPGPNGGPPPAETPEPAGASGGTAPADVLGG